MYTKIANNIFDAKIRSTIRIYIQIAIAHTAHFHSFLQALAITNVKNLTLIVFKNLSDEFYSLILIDEVRLYIFSSERFMCKVYVLSLLFWDPHPILSASASGLALLQI